MEPSSHANRTEVSKIFGSCGWGSDRSDRGTRVVMDLKRGGCGPVRGRGRRLESRAIEQVRLRLVRMMWGGGGVVEREVVRQWAATACMCSLGWWRSCATIGIYPTF
ncbi:hypothetical protein HAX54_006068 [Datura stramonium]|uniref:Uncharacterized protein n=1 Tax=Datura stramonium TaxID=4076 RepID=A0ABS8TAW2_DATST|nr:hypothetical protein [Datura stramonium]